MMNVLIENLERIHTTEMGVERIRRNLGLGEQDVVAWCREKIQDSRAEAEWRGKNWYIRIDGCEITVNAYSYTIITAHRIKE